MMFVQIRYVLPPCDVCLERHFDSHYLLLHYFHLWRDFVNTGKTTEQLVLHLLWSFLCIYIDVISASMFSDTSLFPRGIRSASTCGLPQFASSVLLGW